MYNHHCYLNLHFWIFEVQCYWFLSPTTLVLDLKNVNISKCAFAEYVHQKIDWQINDKGCCY